MDRVEGGRRGSGIEEEGLPWQVPGSPWVVSAQADCSQLGMGGAGRRPGRGAAAGPRPRARCALTPGPCCPALWSVAPAAHSFRRGRCQLPGRDGYERLALAARRALVLPRRASRCLKCRFGASAGFLLASVRFSGSRLPAELSGQARFNTQCCTCSPVFVPTALCPRWAMFLYVGTC